MKYQILFFAMIYLYGCQGTLVVDGACEAIDCDLKSVELSDEELCEAANAHIADCNQGTPGISQEICDGTLAREVLSLTCDALVERVTRGDELAESGVFVFDENQGRGNALQRFACGAGFYFACPAAQCEPEPWIEIPGPEDDCGEWRRFDDCGACAYYRCRERQAQCGEQGYLLGYVGRYCDRFATVTEPRVSPAAAAWLGRVRTCLVDYMADEVGDDASCEEIRERGTASHAGCYVEAGFCDLNIADWFAIVHTIDPGDVPLQQVLTTGHACLRQWF